MIGWIALATAMAADTPATVTVDDVLITAVSPRMPDSGVLRLFVILDVRVSGDQDRMYQPSMHQAQFIPTAGARCTITFHTERFRVMLNDPQVRNAFVKIIDQIDCGTGHFSMDRDGRSPPAHR
jgi:hypothetical protein